MQRQLGITRRMEGKLETGRIHTHTQDISWREKEAVS